MTIVILLDLCGFSVSIGKSLHIPVLTSEIHVFIPKNLKFSDILSNIAGKTSYAKVQIFFGIVEHFLTQEIHAAAKFTQESGGKFFEKSTKTDHIWQVIH